MIVRLKLPIILLFAFVAISACFDSKPAAYIIVDSKSYEASLFRQNCAICHGAEAEGRTLDDGTVVPSLRSGEFKAVTETAIYNQISDGGNGMAPFRGQLTEKEMRMLTEFIRRDLRGQ